MQSPSKKFSLIGTVQTLIVAVVIVVGATAVFSQKEAGPSAVFSQKEAGPSAPLAVGHSLNQCANGKRGTPKVPCAGSQWQNGNLGQNDSQYIEGDSTPYRAVITGLTPGNSYIITLEWDTTKAGKHALDYLTSYDRTETDAVPCSGVVGCDPNVFSTFPIPLDPNFTLNCPLCTQQPGVFTIFNGDITGVSAYTLSGTYEGDSSTRITLTYMPSAETAVISWGGHIARRADWGIDGAATSIPGSPYHMRLKDVAGNQDRSMSVNAIIFPGQVTIIKEVQTVNGTGSWHLPFAFTSSANFGVTNFSLTDDNAGPGIDFIENSQILNFGPTNTITVTEQLAPGWTLGDIICVETPGGLPNVLNTTVNLGTRTASIIVEEGEFVTCTFVNQQIAPSSAPALVQGRVTRSDGNGIMGATVSVINAETGETYRALTNNFGYYTIHDLSVGTLYIMTVNHRSYLFLDASVSFTLDDDLYGMDFTASSGEFGKGSR